MEFSDRTERFATQLTACQSRLYAYIMTLMPEPERAHDVLQEANLVMLRKSSEYVEGHDFVAWACKVAYFEVLSYRRNRARDRHRFDDEFLAHLAEASASRASGFEDRRRALHECLSVLPTDQRDLLMQRYEPGSSVKSIGLRLGRPVASISQTLYRVRNTLLDCVRGKMARGGNP